MNRDKNILYFYKFTCESKSRDINIDKMYTVFVFEPSPLQLKLHPGNMLLYLFWYIFTFGRYSIYYIKNKDGKIIHYSHLLPKFFKFPFMKDGDLEIGPCWTHEEYRGQNLYPYTISRIVTDRCKNGRVFYMMTDETNIPSQKGIEKAGFSLFSKGVKTGLIGRYSPDN